MNQAAKLTKISTLLSGFRDDVMILNANGEFSINIHAENFLIKILNEVYNCRLENVNYAEGKTYPGIDLRDTNGRIAIQVTSTADMGKVTHTLSKYIENELYKDFDKLYIYVITEKQPRYDQAKIDKVVEGRFVFNVENIIDRSDVYLELNKQNDLDKIGRVLHLLEKQFSDSDKGPIRAEALHDLMKASIPEQIKVVGQEKYLPELFVLREAEEKILEFTQFEKTYLLKINVIIENLQDVSSRYNLGKATEELFHKAKKEFLNFNTESLKSIIDELKDAFYFNEIADFILAIEKLVTDPPGKDKPYRISELRYRLSRQPFIMHSKLVGFEANIYEAAKGMSVGIGTIRNDKSFVEIFPSYSDDHKKQTAPKLANDLLLELSILAGLYSKRCLVLVDRAGSGKTNNLCHLAEVLIKEHPVILLSGQMEISNEYDIEYHIQKRLEQEFGGVYSDWINRIDGDLQLQGKWFYILIDGINETNNLPLMLRVFNELLPRIEDKRIKLIISCRDLSWDRFRDAFAPYLFREAVSLKEFTDKEWRNVTRLYFKKFNIECNLEKELAATLRNPLLMRFFCEANAGKKLGIVRGLKLLSIFNLYLERVNQGISRRHSEFTNMSATKLLLSIATEMWRGKTTSIKDDFLHKLPGDPGRNERLQKLVLSENIILEVARHPSSVQKNVRFLYDEFMEYIIAKSWVEEVVNDDNISQKTNDLVDVVIESVEDFQPAFGAILFFDQMMNLNGSLVNRMILSMAKQGKRFREIQMVYAFEHLNLDELNDELIEIIEKFNTEVRNDLKDRLSQVILKILGKRPNLKFGMEYIKEVLEVNADGVSEGGEGDYRKDFSPVLPAKDDFPGNSKSATKDIPPALPPARYHYSIDSKLTAIGILVQSKNNLNDKTIEDGIKRMGNMDLNGALQSLRHLDEGTEQLIYKTIADYGQLNLPEYRIYSAWLLRERYGSIPAGFMISLLTDKETRVHKYVFGLFADRLIETELIDSILNKIENGIGFKTWHLSNIENRNEVKPWHLRYFVKLLGKRPQFHESGSVKLSYNRITSVLEKLQNYENTSIRLEAYRAITKYRGYFNSSEVHKLMADDNDPYIRSYACKYFPT